MFALALWDTHEEKLMLARDRMGIKPLYLHSNESGLIWASEVRALLASGRVERTLDRTGLVDFLRYQTVHGPRTLIQNVEMLPAGHILWADDNEVRTECWWDAATAAKKRVDEGAPWTYGASANRKVRELLTDSVCAENAFGCSFWRLFIGRHRFQCSRRPDVRSRRPKSGHFQCGVSRRCI